MASSDHNYRNPSLFLFLKQIVSAIPLGFESLNNKVKKKGITVVVLKWRQRAFDRKSLMRECLVTLADHYAVDTRDTWERGTRKGF